MNEEIKLKERGDNLYTLLEQVKKIVPTLFLIGKCHDDVGAIFLGSPKEDPDARESDIGIAIYATMKQSEQIRDILLSAVCLFLMKDPGRWMELRKKLDEIMATKARQN
ncbi:MAG: hypothetical protein IKW83_12095 [Muribaculaceae bacterium]|nr:hypothetical protein [Muribaculaceae bacterium]